MVDEGWGQAAGDNDLFRATAAVATAPLDGVEDPPDLTAYLLEPRIVLSHPRPVLAAYFLEPGVMLLHPGEDLPDLLPVFPQFTLLQGKLVMVPGHDLHQIADEAARRADLTTQILYAGPKLHVLRPALVPLLCEPRRRFGHMVTEEPGEPLEGQAVRRISQLSPGP
jgi:hypothetical protein